MAETPIISVKLMHKGLSVNDDGSQEFVFAVWGTLPDDLAAVVNAVLTLEDYPASFENGLERVNTPSVEDVFGEQGYWIVTLRYIVPGSEGGSVGSAGSFSFSTAGDTIHVTQSKESIKTYLPFGGTITGSPFNTTIGDRGEGEPEGTDIPTRGYTFEETHIFTDAQVTDEYIQTLIGLSTCVCNAPFKSCAAGEVQFLYATGGRQAAKWEITFTFKAAPNASIANGTDLTIDDITGIEKKGHEYLWVRSAPVPDNTYAQITQKPRMVVVERNFDEADLSLLKIKVARAGTAAWIAEADPWA